MTLYSKFRAFSLLQTVFIFYIVFPFVPFYRVTFNLIIVDLKFVAFEQHTFKRTFIFIA